MAARGYHYRECGLDNIWLANGYEFVDAPAGRLVKIKDIDGLHRAIGKTLINSKKSLAGREIRFLRQELLISQAALAKLLEVAEQTVHRWERDKGDIPKSAEILIRLLYREHIEEDIKLNVREKLEEIAGLEGKLDGHKITLRKSQKEWMPEKLAA